MPKGSSQWLAAISLVSLAFVSASLMGQQTTAAAPGERIDHNYQEYLPQGHAQDLPVRLFDVKHTRIYQGPTPPRWSSWTSACLTRQGNIAVCFIDMSGAKPDLKPSYGFEYARPQVLTENGIQRRQIWCESRDGGGTWEVTRRIDTSDPLMPLSLYHLRLSDGSILGVGGVLHEWDFTRSTYIYYGQTMAWRSVDDGANWSKPVSINDPKQTLSFSCRPKQLRDGTIVLPAYGQLDARGRKPDAALDFKTDAWLWFSKDQGRTWSEPVVVARGLPDRSNDEPEAVELGDGRLLMILRHSNPGAKGNAVFLNCGQTCVNRTSNGWQVEPVKPTHMGFRGFPALLRTRDGILICAGSNHQFNFSLDEGRTWSPTASIADPALSRQNHYPALLELPDGRVASVYHVGNHWPYPPPQDEWIHATFFRVKRR